ncbi:CERS1 synthase, partial [Podilymbus podiceps]|nr:CERS1 synthase [Podilymbus podiceps]
CNLQPKDAAKMPESAWKLLFYTLSWSYGIYLLFFTDYPFFHDPPSVFYDWKKGMDVPTDIAIAYLMQCSFYGHSIYATAYMDTWRKDSVVMLLHHVVTLTLIASSYAFSWRGLPGGRGLCQGKLCWVSRLSWDPCGPLTPPRSLCPARFWFRLYWFPLKVLYATCYSSLQLVPNIPFYFFFNALLLVLTLMNIYWFLYIVLFVAKVLMGQMQEVNDVREYDVEDSKKT